MEKIICLFRKSILLGFVLLTGFYVHLNAQSHIQHIRTAHEGINFVQHSTAKYSSSEHVVAGTVTPAPISGSSDILVLMTDNLGNVLWKKYVDYGADEFVGSVMVDAGKNIVLTGYTGDNGSASKSDHREAGWQR